MRITDVTTYLVGNPWKNWLFVRVDTDEGIHGVGEGTVNGFSATVETAIHELRDAYVGLEPSQVELLFQRMVRDVYSDGGQIHMAAVAAIEVACWDIVGKATGKPVHELLGGRIRDRIPVYANGWYRTDRNPQAFAEKARDVVRRGYRALKFDPFGAAYRVMDRSEEDLSIAIVAAVRDAVGPAVDLMIEAHNRFSAATALRVADRLVEFRPAWLEEPVHHQQMGAMIEVARRSPIPVATGESFTSLGQFADLLGHDVVHIVQPEPLSLGGLWRTRQVAAMADAHYAVVAPHNAQGPVCGAISRTLGACIPNFYVQESFDEFNADWTHEIVDRPALPVDGFVEVVDEPGLGITVDWERLAAHPYERAHLLRLFSPGWERRDQASHPHG
ncbi:MAG TPA: mandelate racemase/muconate lactonizing enzyme family protein [Candidatus Limnocylindria bacterium]|nr:mandelate racemase/muconate lactonizing enzyme family protein [Candidatus Limnocylindria bacterium]